MPYVPTEQELLKYYKVVWDTKNTKHMILIKILLYTGIRVNELVNVEINDVDLDRCQIRISQGKGGKHRVVPFPKDFRDTLMIYMETEQKNGSRYLFESNRKKAFTTRGVRKILAEYTKEAGMEKSISPHKLRHFLFTWLKTKGIDDALIQPYSGHETRQSLEIYSKLSLSEAQKVYDSTIKEFPV